jgi:hypothetical protein
MMRRSSAPVLEQMKFVQALGRGLRRELADVSEDPLPERLAILVRRLASDPNEHSGEEWEYGTSGTQTSSRIGRGG